MKEKLNSTISLLQSQFLNANFKFLEKGERGYIIINTKNRQIEIDWDLTVIPKMDEADISSEILNSGDHTLIGDESEDGEVIPESDPDDILTAKSSSPDVNFNIVILHGDHSVCIRCTAGVDSRIYILSVAKSKDASPSDEGLIEVNDLSEELQQRLYDYLEELSVTDLIACYIRQYNLCYRNKKQADSLKSLLQYFSK